MSEGDNKDRTLPISAVLLICAALSVVFFNRAPFHPSRPAVPNVPEPYQQIKARLWEDPFLAVINGKKTASSPHGFHSYSGVFHSYSGGPTTPFNRGKPEMGRVTAVGVMVFGATYAEEGEARIRQRYATLSAFKRLGFVPEDPEHISYIKMVNNKEEIGAEVGMSNIIPFERLRHERGYQTVLLLWLNDDAFKDKPLHRLDRLSNFLSDFLIPPKRLPGTPPPDNPPPGSFKVIGPAGSTTLKAMIDDAKAGPIKFRHPIDIYSATATADYPELYDLLKKKQDVSPDGKSCDFSFGDTGCGFKRTVCNDHQLADKISKELGLRGIDCKDKRNHIVLLSEWDTDYGRSVQEIYRQVFFGEGVVNIDSQLHIFSYMRGIDGTLPGSEQTSNKGSEEKKQTGDQDLEQASGMGQLDYLRRLGDGMYHFERQLERGGRIRAIGVLGTDFHDKFLVLQAMRQRFPQAVLFTTDLDARLQHPNALPWSRNLIVASSYNLSLRNDTYIDIQRDLPPFRDSFQTSIFFTILQAFSKTPNLDHKVQDLVMQEPQAKLFEIGRYRAVDLSENPLYKISFHPRHQEAESSKKLLKKIIMLTLVTFLLLFLCSEKLRALIARAFSTKKTKAATLVAAFAACLGIWLFYHCILLRPYVEEPLSFIEGVSTWPTELLRGLAIVLSLFFMWRSHLKGKINTMSICEEFSFRVIPERSTVTASAPKRKDRIGIVGELKAAFSSFFNVVRYDWKVAAPEGEEITVDHYWNEYCRRDMRYYRFRRLLPIVSSYLLLCGLMISFDRPIAPVRGPLSTFVDHLMLALSVLSFTILVFTTFDVIRTCRRLIWLLVKELPPWSIESYEKVLGGHDHKAEAVMKEWMLVHLIARRTSTVSKFIFNPFIVWSIIFLSRLHYFDNWQMPVGLAVVTSLGAIYAWSCAFMLRRSAEEARASALGRLAKLQASIYAKSEPDQEQLSRIAVMMESIKSIRQGAFAPFTQSPVVQSLLVPLGAGGVHLANMLGNFKG